MQIPVTQLFSEEFLSLSQNILINCVIDDGWAIDYIYDNILQFGFDSNILINEKWLFHDVIHPDDRQRVQDEIQKYILEGRDSFRQHYRILSKNNIVYWVEEQKILKRNEDKKVFIVTVRNISKRKQAENALQEERKFLQSIIDGIADPLLVIDTNYNVILSNQAQTKFKSAESSLAGFNKCYQLAHGKQTACDHLQSPCSLKEVLKTKKSVSFIHHHHFDNKPCTHQLIASPLRDGDGSIKAIIEINHDITDLMSTKKQLEDNEVKLNQLIQGCAKWLI